MSGAKAENKCPARRPLPGFAALDPDYEKGKKGGGTPTSAVFHEAVPAGTAAPHGGARLSAFHHGTCCSERTPQLNSRYALPGTRRHQVLPASSPIPVQRVASQTGHHAGRAYPPEPPGSGGDEPPPAGTALAPPAGVTGWRPLRERDSLFVTEIETNVKWCHCTSDGLMNVGAPSTARLHDYAG